MKRASRNGVQNEEEARADNCGKGVNAANTMRSRTEPFSVSLTDSEILDCPVCFESLTIPVYQCDNGHIICNTCCIKLFNKCPTCHLCQHFRAVHKNLAVQFQYDKVLHITLTVHHKLLVLQEVDDGDLFVLNDSTQSHGHGISIFHIAPSWKGGISYFIRPRSEGIVYKFHSSTKNIQWWDDDPPSVPLLFVPSDFFGPYEQLDLAIRIQKPKK